MQTSLNMIKRQRLQVAIHIGQEPITGKITIMAVHSLWAKPPAQKLKRHSAIKKPLLHGTQSPLQDHGWKFSFVPNMGHAGANGMYWVSGRRMIRRFGVILYSPKGTRTD